MNGADDNPILIPHLHRVSLIALLVGGLGALVTVIMAFAKPYSVFPAYLAAFFPWLGVSLGSVALLMMYNLVGGRWGDVIRPTLQTSARGLIVVFVLFLPILGGLKYIYPWMSEGVRLQNVDYKHQYDVWLHPGFFGSRAIVYFALWGFLAWAMNRRLQPDPALLAAVPKGGHGDRGTDLPTRDHNPGGSEAPSGSGSTWLKSVSAPGLVAYAITLSLAAIDWAMSLHPGWYSTIYGFLFIVSQGLGAFAFSTAVLAMLTIWVGRGKASHTELGRQTGSTIAAGNPGRGTNVLPSDFNDLGNLTLTFTILWAYMSFSQFLIQWAGNLKEEVAYYVVRLDRGWQWLGLTLLVGHFFLPFFCLLSRDLKRSARGIGLLAVAILVMRHVDTFWFVAPSVHRGKTIGESLGVADVSTVMMVAGLWIAFFCWQHARRAEQGLSLFPPPAPAGHGHGHEEHGAEAGHGAPTLVVPVGAAVAIEANGGAHHG